MKRTLNYIYAFLAFGILIFIDQFTKYIARTKLVDGKTFSVIKNVLQFNYIRNNGAAWGIMSGKQIFFIIYIYFKIPSDKKYRLLKVILVTLSAGAVGNLIDRIKNGYVDDFIDFYLINFPVFNFADICVCLSMIGLVISIFFVYKDKDMEFLKIRKKESKEVNE